MNLSVKYFNLFLFAVFILLLPLFNNCNNDAVVNSNNDSTNTPIEEPTDTNNYDPCNIDPLPVGVWGGSEGKILISSPDSTALFSVNLIGNNLRKLTTYGEFIGTWKGVEYTNGYPYEPKWSSDGTKIAYFNHLIGDIPIVLMSESGNNKKIIALAREGDYVT